MIFAAHVEVELAAGALALFFGLAWADARRRRLELLERLGASARPG